MPFDNTGLIVTPTKVIDKEELSKLDEAIRLIGDETRWCKKVMYRSLPRRWWQRERFAYCMLGALREAGAVSYIMVMGQWSHTPAAQAVLSAIEEISGTRCPIEMFNDASQHSEVMAVMHRAREILTS